jgi:S1/P1 nuclease
VTRLTVAPCLALVLALSAPPPAHAWNHAGHMVVAYLAYQQLSPDERARVFSVLRAHPDLATLSRLAGSPQSRDYRMLLFLHAARWPDQIRDDARFHDETDPHARPTPLLPGFPDMQKHRPWHFKNEGFSTDGTTPGEPDPINAEAAIHEMRQTLVDAAAGGPRRAYVLSWLEHLVGDVHQPLHCVARFSREHPAGDRGGNLFALAPSRIPGVPFDVTDLHALWDNVLGADISLATVRLVAREAERSAPPEAPGDLDEAHWIEESVGYAQRSAYKPLQDEPSPARIRNAYLDAARAVALQRVKLAGHRLAALIRTSWR